MEPSRKLSNDGGAPTLPSRKAAAGPEARGELRFFNDTWVRCEAAETVRAGVYLAPVVARQVVSVALPALGAYLTRGETLATLRFADGRQQEVAAPVTGRVVRSNRGLAEEPGALASDPFGKGWLAMLHGSRMDSGLARCALREVILVAIPSLARTTQVERLTALGCRVWTTPTPDEAIEWLRDGPALLLVDAASVGRHGPALVRRVNDGWPETRVVVAATPVTMWEEDYRSGGIYYYLVEGFEGDELADLLGCAFK
jgi:glycine cleavage system H protein